MTTPHDPIVVAALYKFTAIEDPGRLQAALHNVCASFGVRGTLLLAREGINGTIAGTRQGIDRSLAAIRRIPGCADIEHKESLASAPPFQRLKIRLKTEIVRLDQPQIDPVNDAGTYVEPEDWNSVLVDPDVVIIDTRNAYEIAIGTFPRAINPGTRAFREFPQWVDDNLDPVRHPKVAMFCTGGIRCEKATALLKDRGFAEVCHLKGGILSYLERVPDDRSMWSGACFVFDERVAVGPGLVETDHRVCPCCGGPVAADANCCALDVEKPSAGPTGTNVRGAGKEVK
ncbi:MAG: rhodanese-related sulfurtransferase [Hyphomicrobiaceae bacterium]